MTNQEKREIERVYRKPFCEVEELEIPAYMREEDEREELRDDHVRAEILTSQEE